MFPDEWLVYTVHTQAKYTSGIKKIAFYKQLYWIN